jgi:RNA polymerase sigma-70 factor (ECF subfamily)
MTTQSDQATFSALVERHRRELHVHCYRMLGSFDEAEDLVQETFLRAWRKRDTYEGRSTFRAWLYRIATNACLDAIERRARQPQPTPPTREGEAPPVTEVLWLQPYPDRLLEGAAPAETEPDATVVAKETIELAFMVAIQHLPPRSRAALILRDVLGWSAKDTAALLETSVAAVNSAVQRARDGLKRHLPERRLEWAPDRDPSEQEQELLARYVEATERGDAEALAQTLHEELRFSMPPDPSWSVGRDATVRSWVEGGFGSEDFGAFRCLVTAANRQPAVANYVRRPGDDRYRLFALDVLRVEDGLVAEIVTFSGDLSARFGLPPTL